MCVFVWMFALCKERSEEDTGSQDADCRQLWASHSERWEPNLGHLEEREVLLTPEPSHQPHSSYIFNAHLYTQETIVLLMQNVLFAM